MKLVKFERGGRNAEGLLEGGLIHLTSDWRHGPADMAPFLLPQWSLAEMQNAAAGLSESVSIADVALAVPLDPRSKVICIGANYRAHALEAGIAESAYPPVFMRHHDTLVAHGQPLIKPRVSEQYDFEGELALVVGRAGRNIKPADAMLHVMGVTCFMDGSVRDYQRQSIAAGKNFWRSGAMGPSIVLARDMPDVHSVRLQTRLNGELVQAATLDQLIHDMATLVSYCSSWARLEPGDVIATGTPEGIGSRRTPPMWIKAGDVIEVEIEDLNVLRNPIEVE